MTTDPGPLCDNWACPAKVSCALHIGRSAAFAAIAERTPSTRTRTLPDGADSCAEYRTDKPRPWLTSEAADIPRSKKAHAHG